MKPGLWELLILLVIILLLFGTKKLRNAGGDIGSAFKNFKKAFKDDDENDQEKGDDKSQLNDSRDGQTQDAEFSDKKDTENSNKS